MTTILSRIQKISENEGITIGAMERSIGASKGVLSRAISNGTDIQAKWIQIIADNYPQYSPEWLLTGKGSMLKDSPPSNPPSETSLFIKTITDQAEEIGRLKERIQQLEFEKKGSVSNAQKHIANVG